MVGAPEETADKRQTKGANGHFPFYYTDLNEVMLAAQDWAQAYSLTLVIDVTHTHVIIVREPDLAQDHFHVLAEYEGDNLCHVILETCVAAQEAIHQGRSIDWTPERVARFKKLLNRDNPASSMPPPTMRSIDCQTDARPVRFP